MLRDLEWIDGEVALGILIPASDNDVPRLKRFPTPASSSTASSTSSPPRSRPWSGSSTSASRG
jgi:hypothetical protein